MEEHAALKAVVRSLGVSWRASRLYPPSSPVPLQTAADVSKAVDLYLATEPSLRLVVVREGFLLRGVDDVFTASGVPDFADALGTHGIAEVLFQQPPSPEEVVAVLAAAGEQPKDSQERGGLQSAIAAAGVTSLKLVPVALASIEAPLEIPEDEAAAFLASLAADSARLSVWLRALLTYDDEGLAEGLLEIAKAAQDITVFGRTLAEAFLDLDTDCKDRLLEASMDLEPVRDITRAMLVNLSAVELAAAIRGGHYGENPSSLSWVLTRLPIGDRSQALVDETKSALASAGTPDAVIGFLEHMMSVRREGSSEPSLVAAQPLYRAALEGARLRPEYLDLVRAEAAARVRLDERGVTTLIVLTRLADTFDLYARVLGALARSVAYLLEQGDDQLAMAVARKLGQRELVGPQPWPETDAELGRATETACGTRSMAALLAAAGASDKAVEYMKELVGYGGEKAALALATASMNSEDVSALGIAEAVLGKRLPELLTPMAGDADARHAARLAELFARDGGSRCMPALGLLAARSEDRVRTEVVRGICAAGGPAVAAFIPALLRDQSREVALVAALSLPVDGDPQAAALLGERLAELDEDERDLSLARVIVQTLTGSRSETAETALRRFAEGGSFRRKRKTVQMRALARDALETIRVRGQG